MTVYRWLIICSNSCHHYLLDSLILQSKKLVNLLYNHIHESHNVYQASTTVFLFRILKLKCTFCIHIHISFDTCHS